MSKTLSSLNDHDVFVSLVAFRLLNAITVRTFFQPDEYYQALEPAWNFTPGNNGAWITWEWTQHLRSALHPALFSGAFFLAESIKSRFADPYIRNGIILYTPKIVQAVLAASSDSYAWKLSSKVYGTSKLGNLTLYLTLLSPWQWFCSTRTFSNGLESTLTVAALYYWPFSWSTQEPKGRTQPREQAKKGEQEHVTENAYIALVLAATAVILRPTNILIWVVLASFVLFKKQRLVNQDSKGTSKAENHNVNEFFPRLFMLARAGTVCGISVFVVSLLIDRAFYTTWTIPALNFLYFNVVQSLAVFYGNNNWHYYLTEGYPLLLTTALPFALVGLYRIFRMSPGYLQFAPRTRESIRQLGAICVALPAALSVLSHKEVRFIYPIIGPLLIIATAPLSQFFEPVLAQPPARGKTSPSSKPIRTLLLILLVSINILIAGYTTIIHNSGLIALPEYIRTEFQTNHQNPTSPYHRQNLTLAVLMPCHSIPWRSHFLNPPTQTTPGIQAWALTCEPPLHLTSAAEKRTYLDEADVFYANPTLWLRNNMSRRPPRDFFTSDLKATDPQRSPGIYTADRPSNARNKFLWQNPPDSASGTEVLSDRGGLDITDLLPYLRTAPGKPPATETGVHIRRPWPHYIAFFEQLEPVMARTLRGSGYVECWRRFNSHWHDDWRRKGDVVVWCLFPERAVLRRSVVDVDVEGDGVGVDNDGRVDNQKRSESEQGERQTRVVADRPGIQTVIRF